MYERRTTGLLLLGTLLVVAALAGATSVAAAPATLPAAAAPTDVIGRDIEINPVLELAESNRSTYLAELKRDHLRFVRSAGRLEKLSEAMFRKDSPLDKLGRITQVSNTRGLKSFYRFYRSFLLNLAVMSEISEKYRSGWKDRLTGTLSRAFEGYLLGVDANLCRLTVVTRLVGFVDGRSKLETLLNEANAGAKIPGRAFEKMALEAIAPAHLYRLYHFHLSNQGDLEAFYAGKPGEGPQVDTQGQLKAYYDSYRPVLDQLLSRIAKDGSWYKYVFGKVGHAIKEFFFPLQKSIFTWVGDTRVKARKTRCITEDQLHEMQKSLLPGDIIFERQEYFLSNIFLSGFWPHAELYLGTPQQMSRRLDGDPAVQEFCRKQGAKGFVDYLAKRYPKPVEVWQHRNRGDGNPNVVLEAISEGVVFSSMEEANHADFCAAVRPRLAPIDIARAIDVAFSYYGREYDFRFDFATEEDIVCTELVAKSYAPAHGKKGLVFRAEEYMGDQVVRADWMVETYAKEAGSPKAQLSFVYFLMGDPKKGVAIVADEPTFRRSYTWKGGLRSKPD